MSENSTRCASFAENSPPDRSHPLSRRRGWPENPSLILTPHLTIRNRGNQCYWGYLLGSLRKHRSVVVGWNVVTQPPITILSLLGIARIAFIRRRFGKRVAEDVVNCDP